jgi:hypothetical protein
MVRILTSLVSSATLTALCYYYLGTATALVTKNMEKKRAMFAEICEDFEAIIAYDEQSPEQGKSTQATETKTSE